MSQSLTEYRLDKLEETVMKLADLQADSQKMIQVANKTLELQQRSVEHWSEETKKNTGAIEKLKELVANGKGGWGVIKICASCIVGLASIYGTYKAVIDHIAK